MYVHEPEYARALCGVSFIADVAAAATTTIRVRQTTVECERAVAAAKQRTRIR